MGRIDGYFFLERSVSLNPIDEGIGFILSHAWTMNALKKHDEALELLEAASVLYPESIDLKEKLVNQLVTVGRDKDATTERERVKVLVTKSQREYFTRCDLSKRDLIVKLKKILDNCLGSCSWLVDKESESKIESEFFSYPWDGEADWVRFSREPLGKGSIVDFGEIGRFFVGNSDQVIQKRIARSIPWELHIVVLMRELVRRLNSNTLVLDIGANIGATAIPLAKSFGGNVICFEPVEETIMNLKGNISLNNLKNISLNTVALSDEPGKGDMFNINPLNPGVAKLAENVDGAIDVNTLDSIFFRNDNPVSFIKIDVEGHEEKVLRGGGRGIK